MQQTHEFNFGNDSVANSYDSVLVPTLFKPWAERLIKDHQPWEDRRVLDLATGTGILAQLLARRVGSAGKVIGADINRAMLEVAKIRCADPRAAVEFVNCSADALDLPDGSVDVVVCQQGFQFFPNKLAAATEVFRVLRPSGQFIATTWRPVGECQFFGKICDALESIGEREIADTMRIPFDLMDEPALLSDLEVAGFHDVQLERQHLDLVMEGGHQQALEMAYATPIGPALRGLDAYQRVKFEKALAYHISNLTTDGTTMGCMVSSVFRAQKPSLSSTADGEATSAAEKRPTLS